MKYNKIKNTQTAPNNNYNVLVIKRVINICFYLKIFIRCVLTKRAWQ